MAVKENRAFSEMLAVAQRRLTGRSPLEIAEKAHVTFDQEQQVFLFPSLGEKLWDLSIILNEASNRAGAGGPFWIIG